MKVRLLLLIVCVIGLSSCTCRRSRGEFWEDTKTCGRYVGKGLRSLMGDHANSGGPVFFDSWQDEEYVALKDAEFSELGDSFPPASESPGDPGSGIPSIEHFRTPEGRLAELFNTIHFETDNYTISGSDNFRILKEIADYLMSHQKTYVFVEGHADERGAAAYNLALGSKRANAVRGFLIQNGVNPDQLFAISFGKERPLSLGHDELAWSQNRRAQFKLYER